MKKWTAISAIIVVGVAIVGLAISSTRSSGHHELIKRLDSKAGEVELFWDAPKTTDKKLPAIVYVHGLQDESRPGAINLVKGDVLSATAKMGYFAAAMSMPGYGQSSGERDFCGRESQLALQSTVAYLRNRPDVDSSNIAVSGFSCGANVASMIADKEPLAAMILISGVYEFEDMYAKWRTPEWPLEREVMNFIENRVAADGGLKAAARHRSALPNANQFKMPLLLIAGGKDRKVDGGQSRVLAKAIESNGHANRLIFNPEGGHAVPYEDWVKYSTEFLGKNLNRK